METVPVNSESDLNLIDKIKILENENKKMHDEFNIQRAKLKDLFLQKESECLILKKELDEMKSQFLVSECKKDNEIQLIGRKAKEEISSLQHIVQEAFEESSICKNDLEKLFEENGRLKEENQRLKEELIECQESSSLAPVFTHVKKTLTKKLVGDTSISSNSKEENIDDSSKFNKYAQEDAEVLRSLVVPLEEEIRALKEKLRTTDDELQLHKNAVHTTNEKLELTSTKPNLISHNGKDYFSSEATETINKSTSMQFHCENCKLKEEKNLELVENIKKKEEKIENLEKSLNESKNELIKEAELRRDLENQWQEKRELHKEEVLQLSDKVEKSEKELNNLSQQFFHVKETINRQISRLTEDRESVNKHLEILQRDNAYLSGQFLASSEELENQSIDLPNNISELHELILKLQSDLLRARVGVEYEKRQNVTSIDEINILRDQLKIISQERETEKIKVQNKIKSLEVRLREVLMKGEDYEQLKEKADRKEAEMSKNISELRVQIIELQGANEKHKKINEDLKSKIIILQKDFKTSEDVQKDFVKLSQSLQMALEGFRQADSQVRWQDDEDVEKCPNCSVMFTVTCRKQHCRHCGKIFCEKCLTKTVPSGPRQKLARVCDICHTVLTPNTAPFFSKELPQSPL